MNTPGLVGRETPSMKWSPHFDPVYTKNNNNQDPYENGHYALQHKYRILIFSKFESFWLILHLKIP